MPTQDSSSNAPDAADQQGTVETAAAHINEKEAIPPLFGQAPLLRLLAPPRVSVDRTGNISLWTPSVGKEFGILRVRVPRTVWVKMLKSCVLVAKVRNRHQLYDVFALMNIVADSDYDDPLYLSRLLSSSRCHVFCVFRCCYRHLVWRTSDICDTCYLPRCFPPNRLFVRALLWLNMYYMNTWKVLWPCNYM